MTMRQLQYACFSSGIKAADIKAAATVATTAANSATTNSAGASAAMSDAQVDELYQAVKHSTAAAPELRHHLVSHLRQAQGTAQRLQASNDCGTAHPAAKLTQRQDGLGNSIVRMVSFVESSAPKRPKGTGAAAAKGTDAADKAVPFPKPKPRSKKRTLAQTLADKVKDKENVSVVSTSVCTSGCSYKHSTASRTSEGGSAGSSSASP